MGYVQTERDFIIDLTFDLVNYSLTDLPPPTPPPMPPARPTGFNDVPMEVIENKKAAENFDQTKKLNFVIKVQSCYVNLITEKRAQTIIALQNVCFLILDVNSRIQVSQSIGLEVCSIGV